MVSKFGDPSFGAPCDKENLPCTIAKTHLARNVSSGQVLRTSLWDERSIPAASEDTKASGLSTSYRKEICALSCV